MSAWWVSGGRTWEAERIVAQQKVSGATAAVVIGIALVVFVVVFGRSSLAPEDKPPFQLPPEPPVEQKELTAVRQGLEPLGISVVMPPLVEDRRRGVRVAAVKAGSVADAAGIQPGDLLVSFDGRPLMQPMNLVAAVNLAKPEAVCEVVLERDGEEMTVKVTGLVPLPPEELNRLVF